MAEVLLRDRLARDGRSTDWRVESAGTWAVVGHPASGYAIEEMARRGLDLRDHRAQPVRTALMARADVVLGMTHRHVRTLTRDFTAHAHKVHLLSSLVGGDYDINDPYGGTRMEYAYVAQELEELIEAAYDRILALAEGVGE
jgi:protein-tyrosine phosphatase